MPNQLNDPVHPTHPEILSERESSKLNNALPLILASQSPRRAQLLAEAGFVFEQRSPSFADPDQPPTELRGHQAEDYASLLALKKADSLTEEIEGGVLIVAADTICVDADGLLVGKPRDSDDARAMLRSFINAEHRVITGVSVVVREHDGEVEGRAFADIAIVRFGSISEAQLAAYVATDDWQGKAGGYNLFDRQAAGWPIEVEGDPTTVVGLPMDRLVPLLKHCLAWDG